MLEDINLFGEYKCYVVMSYVLRETVSTDKIHTARARALMIPFKVVWILPFVNSSAKKSQALFCNCPNIGETSKHLQDLRRRDFFWNNVKFGGVEHTVVQFVAWESGLELLSTFSVWLYFVQFLR